MQDNDAPPNQDRKNQTRKKKFKVSPKNILIDKERIKSRLCNHFNWICSNDRGFHLYKQKSYNYHNDSKSQKKFRQFQAERKFLSGETTQIPDKYRKIEEIRDDSLNLSKLKVKTPVSSFRKQQRNSKGLGIEIPSKYNSQRTKVGMFDNCEGEDKKLVNLYKLKKFDRVSKSIKLHRQSIQQAPEQQNQSTFYNQPNSIKRPYQHHTPSPAPFYYPKMPKTFATANSCSSGSVSISQSRSPSKASLINYLDSPVNSVRPFKYQPINVSQSLALNKIAQIKKNQRFQNVQSKFISIQDKQSPKFESSTVFKNYNSFSKNKIHKQRKTRNNSPILYHLKQATPSRQLSQQVRQHIQLEKQKQLRLQKKQQRIKKQKQKVIQLIQNCDKQRLDKKALDQKFDFKKHLDKLYIQKTIQVSQILQGLQQSEVQSFQVLYQAIAGQLENKKEVQRDVSFEYHSGSNDPALAGKQFQAKLRETMRNIMRNIRKQKIIIEKPVKQDFVIDAKGQFAS